MTAPAWLFGDWQQPHGHLRSLRSPVDGEALAEWVDVDPAGLDALLSPLASVDLAHALPVSARCAALSRLADTLEADAARLAQVITRENGCPAAQAEKLQVHSAVGLLRAMVAIGTDFAFSEERAAARGGRVRIEHCPVGPSLGIVPWNVPLFLACAKIASSLVAGCPILLKPSPENALSMRLFTEHLAALDLPAGAVNLLVGDRDLGVVLVDHPVFAKVSFTGSTAAGRRVAQACARRLARCTLELGGKSAAILLDDVEFSAIADELFLAMMQNNGQVCGAQSRVLVPRSRYVELRDALTALFDGLVVGDPRDHTTQIGPVVSAAQASRIRGLCASGEAAGARLLNRPAPTEAVGSAFVAPRLYALDDRVTENPLWTEEVFGPVTVLAAYSDDDHAVALANASRHGLAASVWSPDTDRAARLASRLAAGTVAINSKKILDFAAPFGGWRESGLGREFGPEGIREYLQARSILVP